MERLDSTEESKNKLFYGYIVVAAATCIMFIGWGANRSFGVFLEPMLNEFGWTRAGISGAFTLVWFILGLVTIVAGRLVDWIGPRMVLTGCGIILGGGYMLVSQIGTIWQFYLFYGVIAGFGMSGCYAPLNSIVPRWFVTRRALMSGAIIAGAAFGIAVMPIISTLLISVYGWRLSYIILGAIVLAIILPAAQFLKRDPGQIGLLPYGMEKAKTEGVDLQAAGYALSAAIGTRQFWLLCLISFGDLFLMNVVTVHIVIHAIGVGIGATSAASILSVAAGVSVFARIIVGASADRMGNKPVLLLCLISAVAAYALLLVARDLWVFYLFAFIFGFGLWSSGAILGPIMADLFGLKALGTIFSSISFAGAIGGAVGPLIVGYLYDISGSYQPGFMLCVGLAIIIVITVILLRPLTSK